MTTLIVKPNGTSKKDLTLDEIVKTDLIVLNGEIIKDRIGMYEHYLDSSFLSEYNSAIFTDDMLEIGRRLE